MAEPSCFNPHTHTGCDRKIGLGLRDIVVSIHTPIQGVTNGCGFLGYSLKVSIHTPIQGVTPPTDGEAHPTACFNPHTHTGCDSYGKKDYKTAVCFNPHTHTGCDCSQFLQVLRLLCFNPHTHTGCDLRYLDASY